MKRKRLAYLLGILAVPLAGYAVWARTGRGAPPPTDPRVETAVSWGTDAGRGNLLGVEPFMVPADYASEANFHAKLDAYFAAAKRRGWLGSKTVVVLPEYTGTWLVTAGEKRSVYEADSTTAALTTMALTNPMSFASAFAGATEKDRAAGAAFRMKAATIANAYDGAFSRLTRKYGVTIVAGSVILPSPQVVQGRLTLGDGPLYNVSIIYGPLGMPTGLVRKVYPTTVEKPFCASGAAGADNVFDTPAGRLGVLVCANSWTPALYDRLRENGAEFVAVPSFGAEPEKWNAPWGGYDGQPASKDADPADVGRITEKQAWLKYAMPARLKESGARAGLNVFTRGRFWGYHGESQTLGVSNGATHVRPADSGDGGALINLWL